MRPTAPAFGISFLLTGMGMQTTSTQPAYDKAIEVLSGKDTLVLQGRTFPAIISNEGDKTFLKRVIKSIKTLQKSQPAPDSPEDGALRILKDSLRNYAASTLGGLQHTSSYFNFQVIQGNRALYTQAPGQ